MWIIGASLLALAAVAVPQDLAPEVLLLSRIKRHMRDEVSQLPNYTCLETVSRFHRAGPHSDLNPLDTVRLEIIYSDHKEWYGSPGERNVNNSNPSSFVGSGLMGSGAFATTLTNVMSGAHFAYQGKENVGERKAVRYDFQFFRQPGAFQISMVGGSGYVGEKGAIWIDPESLDLIRIEAHADDIPGYLPLAAQTTTVNYVRTRIGDRSALLAQEGEMDLVESEGIENYDRLDFTHCRAYSSESAIRFDAEPSFPVATTAAPAAPGSAPNLPALLRVAVRLTTPVSSGDSVGTLIGGKVSGNVLYKGKIVLRDGAAVQGRIRRLERYQGKGSGVAGDYIVGLEFTDVEAVGGHAPFYADLLSLDRRPDIRAALKEQVSAGEAKITLPELPGVASFFVSGKSFTIPAGFGTEWRTRGPIR